MHSFALPTAYASSHTVGWAFYNSIRYFLSFRLYDKSAPQAYAFALGACTGTSVALAICRFAIGFITFKPQRARVDLVSPVLAYLSSLLLLIPAVVNLVLVTTTKRSNDLQFNVLHRCRLDVDVVWSITRRICEPPESRWPAWAVLAAVRFLLTLSLLVRVSSPCRSDVLTSSLSDRLSHFVKNKTLPTLSSTSSPRFYFRWSLHGSALT